MSRAVETEARVGPHTDPLHPPAGYRLIGKDNEIEYGDLLFWQPSDQRDAGWYPFRRGENIAGGTVNEFWPRVMSAARPSSLG